MIDGMREHSLSDPKFLVDQMFSVRLSWEKQRLNEREKFILENLKADQKTTPTTLAKRFNISLTTAVKDFTRLVKLGMVKKEGTGRGSSYALTKSY